MFFFGDRKVEITFEVDETLAENFNNALLALNKTKEEAFQDFLAGLIAKALRGNAPESEPVSIDDGKKLTPETIRSRIVKWAKNPTSYPHYMMRAYFEAAFASPEGSVYRFKMQGRFNYLAGIEDFGDDKKFLSFYRQMCSSSFRAYGDIFVIHRGRPDLVFLNPAYQDLILSLREAFLQ